MINERKYIILKDYDPKCLSAEVESYMANGWLLQGGVSITCNPSTGVIHYAQALSRFPVFGLEYEMEGATAFQSVPMGELTNSPC